MTRFIGDAIGSRAGKGKGTSAKDLKKDMEVFKKTGVHPSLQRSSQKIKVPLPEKVSSRPYVYFKLRLDNKDLGRLVIECFEDVAPLASSVFKDRVADGSFSGTIIHKLLRHYAAFGGKVSSSKQAQDSVHIKRYPDLCHVEPGAVSMSLDGSEFAIGLTSCTPLDDTYQVIGRISHGMEDVFDTINKIPTDSDDCPRKRIVIVDCGFTDAQGGKGTSTAGGRGGEKDFVETAEEARQAIKQAIEYSLGQKRKQQPEATKPVKRGMMNSLLDDDDVSDSEEESEKDEK